MLSESGWVLKIIKQKKDLESNFAEVRSFEFSRYLLLTQHEKLRH